MMRGLLPLPVLALMALPALADAPQDACLPLTDVAELCLQDTDWATGFWMQGGDGSALTLGNVTLAMSRDWTGRDAEAEDRAGEIKTVVAGVTSSYPEARIIPLDRIDMPGFVVYRSAVDFGADAAGLRGAIYAIADVPGPDDHFLPLLSDVDLTPDLYELHATALRALRIKEPE